MRGKSKSCSVCGSPSHNKRTCPDRHNGNTANNARPASQKKAKACKYCGDADPNHWEDICAMRDNVPTVVRLGTRCGYCGKRGHTRANCARRRKHKRIYFTQEREYRKQVYDYIKENGWGHGAIVQITREYFDSDAKQWKTCKKALMITDINWDVVSFTQKAVQEDEEALAGWSNRGISRDTWLNVMFDYPADKKLNENYSNVKGALVRLFSLHLIGSPVEIAGRANWYSPFHGDQKHTCPLPLNAADNDVYVGPRWHKVELLNPSHKFNEPSAEWFNGRGGVSEDLF
jgi:hypothetical protein